LFGQGFRCLATDLLVLQFGDPLLYLRQLPVR
jgi:hypothetical protein